MPEPKSRSRIIAMLETERRRLEQSLARLSDAQMLAPGVIGCWTMKDVLAHLADWEAHMPGWWAATRRGETVPEIEAGLSWKQIDEFNERVHQRHRDQTLAEVRADFDEAHRRFMAMVEAMPEEEMLARGRYALFGKGACYNWLSAYAAHDRWAKSHLRQWIKEGR